MGGNALTDTSDQLYIYLDLPPLYTQHLDFKEINQAVLTPLIKPPDPPGRLTDSADIPFSLF